MTYWTFSVVSVFFSLSALPVGACFIYFKIFPIVVAMSQRVSSVGIITLAERLVVVNPNAGGMGGARVILLARVEAFPVDAGGVVRTLGVILTPCAYFSLYPLKNLQMFR